MKKIALLTAVIFAVTSLAVLPCFNALADTASDSLWNDGYTTVYSRDGSAAMSAQGSGSGLTLESNVSLLQKENDTGYFWSGTPEVSLLADTHGKTFVNTNLPSHIEKYCTDNGSYPKYIAVDFDVMFTKGANAIGFRGKQSGGSVTTFFRITSGTDVNTNEWKHITALIGADGTNNTVRVFINGEECTQKAMSTPEGSYGFAQFGWLIPFADANTPVGIYLDNVKIMLGNGEYKNSIAVPEITDAGDFTLNTSSNTINTVKPVTVSYLLDNLTLTEGAKAFVITDAAETVQQESTVKNTYKAVVAMDNIYNYYSIAYDSDTLLSGWSCSSYSSDFGTMSAVLKPQVNSAITDAVFSAGVASPQKSDTAIRAYSENLESNLGAGGMFLLSRLDTLIGSQKYKYVTFEYDVFFASENTGTFLRFCQYTDSGNTNPVNIYAGTGSSNMSVNASNIASVSDIKPYTWNKIAMVFGADGVNNVCTVYVNGKEAASGTMPEGAYGVSTKAPNSYFSVSGNSGNALDLYIDNIAVYAGSTGYSAPDSSQILGSEDGGFTVDLSNKKITPVNRSVTLSEFKKSVTVSSNTAEIAALTDEITKAESDNTLLAYCKFIALISTDGIWTYYDVDSSLKADYYGISANALYTYTENSEVLRSYTDITNPLLAEKNITTVICFYDENSALAGVEASCVKTSPEKTAQMFTTDAKIPENAKSFNILIWDDFTRCMPLASTGRVNIDERLFFILKFDDLFFSDSSANKYGQWLGYLDNYGIHATAGAIAQTFDNADLSNAADAERAEKMKKWIENGHEIWCHGYTTNLEFGENYTAEQQKQNLDTCFNAIKKTLGYDMHVLGTPGNVNTSETIGVINEYPDITSVFMISDSNGELTKPNYKNIVHSEKVVDGGTRVVADYFKSMFKSKITSRTKDAYAITQIHPTWKNDDDLENFKVIMNFLLTQNVCFMTPSEYTDYINSRQ